jgi:hypothetical protein
LDVEVSPARRTVSAPPIISREDECTYDTMPLIPRKPVLVYDHADSAGTSTNDFLLGMVGVIVVAAILGLSVYYVVSYLL